MRRSRASLLILGLLSAGAGCTGTTDTTTTTTVDDSVPTTVTVLPASFQGKIPCSNNEGAMRSYVVTLTDTTHERQPFNLPSSPPTPCSQPVAFRFVITGHQYIATIDGYDRPASELTPAPYFDPSSGSPTMLHKDPAHPALDKTLASPRWRADCLEAVLANSASNVNITACGLLQSITGDTPTTGILVDARGALGLLACADGGGMIDRFDVQPDDPTLPSILGLPCVTSDDTGVAAYRSEIKEGVNYTFSVSAHTTGSTKVDYVTTCSAKAQKGLVVVATCAPLH